MNFKYDHKKVLTSMTADKYAPPYFGLFANTPGELEYNIRQFEAKSSSDCSASEVVKLFYDLDTVAGMEKERRFGVKQTDDRYALVLPLCRTEYAEDFVRWCKGIKVEYMCAGNMETRR